MYSNIILTSWNSDVNAPLKLHLHTSEFLDVKVCLTVLFPQGFTIIYQRRIWDSATSFKVFEHLKIQMYFIYHNWRNMQLLWKVYQSKKLKLGSKRLKETPWVLLNTVRRKSNLKDIFHKFMRILQSIVLP